MIFSGESIAAFILMDSRRFVPCLCSLEFDGAGWGWGWAQRLVIGYYEHSRSYKHSFRIHLWQKFRYDDVDCAYLPFCYQL